MHESYSNSGKKISLSSQNRSFEKDNIKAVKLGKRHENRLAACSSLPPTKPPVFTLLEPWES